MGSIFDLCASRKNNEDEAIFIENQNDKEFCQKFSNGCITNATLPSGLKVPSRRYGKDWIIKNNKIILEKRTTGENLKCDFIILIAPNDVGYSHHHRGKVCSNCTLPSGLKVPEKKNGRDWIFDGEAVVLN